MKKMIMILGAGVFQVPAIKCAKEMGYAVLACDRDPAAPGFQYADYTELVSTKDVDDAVRCARKYALRYDLCGVFTAGTDVSYTVACVAQALGLPGIAPEAALRATNKYLMRQALAEHGVPCPQFVCADTLDEAVSGAETIGYPLVMKPVDNMGARGVRRLDTEEELREQFAKSFAHSGRYGHQSVIIEEFMDGSEISMDTLVDQNGDVHLLTIADRHIAMPPYFVETGHSIPSRLSDAVLAQAFDVMQQAIRAVGITRGAAKADIKITRDGAKIGEITARLSGGYHSQYTDPLATGMCSTKAALDIAVGNPLDRADITPSRQQTAIERALIPEAGVITEIAGIEEAERIPGVSRVFLSSAVGDELFPLESNIGKAGHVIAYGDSREAAEAAYEKARQCVRITTKPRETVIQQ